MEKPKQKIKAKQFLEDFRAGKSEAELMRTHGLNRVTLEKLYNVLIEKDLLKASELRPAKIEGSARDADAVRVSQSVEPPEYAESLVGVPEAARNYNKTQCPQCGATVGKRALTCPECGHMLSGEERWESVEPQKRLVDRVPPMVLGCIIALFVGVGLFFLFKALLPLSESAANKRANAIRNETKGEAPMQFAKNMAGVASSNVIKDEVQRLTVEDVLVRANSKFTVFVAGPGWNILGHDGKVKQLSSIRTALRRSGMDPYFRLVSDSGQLLAQVRGRDIQIYDKPEDQSPASVTEPTGTQPAASRNPVGESLEREVQKRLPAGLKRGFPNNRF
jgi:hypothetical protein